MGWFSGGPTIPVLRLTGMIGAVTPLRPGLSLASMAEPIERAFAMKWAPAVAIVVNSPGGSPVQSRLIFKRIRALAEEKAKPVYVFAEDVMASGGYLIALAGDEIYADDNSIVGSIGVVSASFGFVRAIDKLGVERRVYTSGESKVSLDPFLPEKEDDIERLKALQRDVHESFISLVRERRGARLKEDGGKLFTGEFWSGERARDLGLVDGLSDVRTKMREIYGEKVKLKLISSERGWLRRRLGLVGSMGGDGQASLAEDALSTLEARAIWARFGF